MPRGTDRYDEARLQGRLWTPAAWVKTKLTAWYDFSVPGVTLSSGNVSTIADLSPNARTVTFFTPNWPTYNAIGWKAPGRQKAAAVWANSSQAAGFFAANISYSGATGMSARAVVRNNGTAAARIIFEGQAGGAGMKLESASTLSLTKNGTGNIQAGALVMASGYGVVGIDAATNLSRCWVNGQSEQQTATDPAFTGAIRTLGVSSASSFDGETGEYVFTSPILTQHESELLDGYLAWKWGAVENLYRLHPFKNRPPLIGD